MIDVLERRLVSRRSARMNGNVKSSGYGPASNSATASKASQKTRKSDEVEEASSKVEVKSKISPETRATLPPELVALLASPDFGTLAWNKTPMTFSPALPSPPPPSPPHLNSCPSQPPNARSRSNSSMLIRVGCWSRKRPCQLSFKCTFEP